MCQNSTYQVHYQLTPGANDPLVLTKTDPSVVPYCYPSSFVRVAFVSPAAAVLNAPSLIVTGVSVVAAVWPVMTEVITETNAIDCRLLEIFVRVALRNKIHLLDADFVYNIFFMLLLNWPNEYEQSCIYRNKISVGYEVQNFILDAQTLNGSLIGDITISTLGN